MDPDSAVLARPAASPLDRATPPRRAALVSFRLGGDDGVSVIAASWQRALLDAGWQVRTVAGEGPVDVRVPGLALAATEPPDPADVEDALSGCDVVVVENLLTIPMQLPASRVVAAALRGRPAVLHHHDPPWQRARYAHVTELPPDDPAWRHVTINRLTAQQFAARGIPAISIPNGFAMPTGPGDRDGTRARLGCRPGELLVLHPVRAIARKRIPAALALAEALGGTYWLTGAAEEGYGPELERLLEAASCPVKRGRVADPADMYAAADLVLLCSEWEGFGNPVVEGALHRRPLAISAYPVAGEFWDAGMRWADPDDVGAVRRSMLAPDAAVLDRNRRIAEAVYSLDVIAERVRAVVDEAVAGPRRSPAGPTVGQADRS